MWEDATHYFIHSGTSAKDHSQAGLLTIISKRVVDKGSLRFISAIDGRLLRVQFKHGPRQVDVINFYQHTWRPTKHVQSLRHKAWDSLTQQIQAVPLRSRLLVGGDFNTPCTASSPYAGPNVLHKPEHGIQDADDLQAIVQGLDLVFLNTFSQAVPAHTYQRNQQRSQIDFWLTRRLQAGGKAKLAGPMPDFHVGRWRGGPRYMPVQASLMCHWQPWEHRKFQHLATQTEVDRHAILRASSAADDPRIPQFRADVQTLVSQGSLSIEQLQTRVFELACKHFPKRPPQRAEKPWQDGALTHYAETMWSHFRARWPHWWRLTSPNAGREDFAKPYTRRHSNGSARSCKDAGDSRLDRESSSGDRPSYPVPSMALVPVDLQRHKCSVYIRCIVPTQAMDPQSSQVPIPTTPTFCDTTVEADETAAAPAADHALTEMFGPLLGKRATPTTEPNQQSTAERPNKSGKQNEGGKGKGPNKRQPGRYRGGGRSSPQGDQDGGLNRETLKLVARALVHQQEAIDTLRLSTGWIWWLRIPEPTVIPTLIEAAELWREQVTKKDSKLKANNTLAKNSGWIDSNGRWVFQRWNPELRALEVDSSRSALTHEELIRTIKEIQSLIHPETLSRFHVLRHLEPQMEGQTVRVMMDIALRCPEATQLFQGLTTLQGNSSLQLVWLQFKRSTMQRPPLIKQILVGPERATNMTVRNFCTISVGLASCNITYTVEAAILHQGRFTCYFAGVGKRRHTRLISIAMPGGLAAGTLHCKFSAAVVTSVETPFLEWNIPATHTELTLDVTTLAPLPPPLEQEAHMHWIKILGQALMEAAENGDFQQEDEEDEVFIQTWIPSNLNQVSDQRFLDRELEKRQRGEEVLYERLLACDEPSVEDEPAPGEAKQIANNSESDDEPEDPDEAASGSELEEGAKNDGHRPDGMDKAEWKRKVKEEKREKRKDKVPKALKKKFRKQAAQGR
ncbi:Serine/threonine-protein kinase RIO1 [Symbiodinium microadriaticum]|uniref:Serine/threonine-protein kinase RIO1 n=1 Tax=Symbiodinium microadriaticum TaxID=2951 RepID=A0A1Q9D616_SYMMI|nr:Serine/threonine-protein kinase RIO1 [Symbiodinium microadriaticum]